MKKVLVSDNLSEKGVNVFKAQEGIEVDVNTGLSEEELIKIIPEYHGIVIRSATKVNPNVIEAAKNLKVVGRAGTGVDNVDLNAASKRGIVVMNTPGGNTVTTAEHAVSMMLSLARKIPQASASVKAKKWEKKKFMGVEIQNKNLGVIGLGRIGSIVVKCAQGLGMNVTVFDPFISLEAAKKLCVERVEDLTDLLKKADFITIHSPKTSETTNLLSDKEFGLMKDGVRIINCARGGIVDEKALFNAIKEKKVAGAALDVFLEEPATDNPLIELDEVICTPHIGASTDEAQEIVAVAVAEQICDYLIKNNIRNAVNIPSVDLAVQKRIEPFIALGNKMGSFQAQLINGGMKKVTVTYRGEIAGLDVKHITLSILKGFLNVFTEDDVNFINAPIIAKERGIEVIETKIADHKDYASLISIEVETDKEKRTLEGTIFGKNEQRIVKLDDYILEANPNGTMLVCSNEDTPGVIGAIGCFLGENSINIGSMHLGRTKWHESAVALVNVDTKLSDEILDKMKKLRNIIYIKQVQL